MKKLKQLNIRISEDELENIKKKCNICSITISEYVRKIVVNSCIAKCKDAKVVESLPK